ncbi:hypothetical protein ACWEWQ_32575, partial [Streptomyces sp. NPDC003832]
GPHPPGGAGNCAINPRGAAAGRGPLPAVAEVVGGLVGGWSRSSPRPWGGTLDGNRSAVGAMGAADPPAPSARLTTREHVRPHWQSGTLVLTAMPAAGGTLVPFEVPEPTPCCADH